MVIRSASRGLTEAREDGCVIRNEGTLIVADSVGSGQITGGRQAGDGGGILNTGTLTLEGGNVSGNLSAGNGGGIFNSGTVKILAGTLSGNTAGESGGGLFIEASGTATLSGGLISGNTAGGYHGGGIYNRGVLNMDGGRVTGNEAKAGLPGGGQGGGILQNGTMSVSGTPFVSGNEADNGSNLFLCSAHSVMNVTEALTKGAALGVTSEDDGAVITSGYCAYNTELPTRFFMPDVPDCRVILENGEVRLTTTAGFTVTFDSNGGSPMDSQTVLDGEKAADPGAPMNNGNAFAGWHLVNSDESTAVEEYDFEALVHANITLRARWIPVWVVIFDSDNGENAKTFPVHDGNTVDQPTPDPKREGSQFAGWYAVREDGSLAADLFDFDTHIVGDTILRAKWVSTVTFESGGGSEVPDQKVAKGEKATEPAPPEKAGFVFSGWVVEDPETHLLTWYDFETPVTKNITLTALWKKDGPGIFTVTFDCGYDGGIVFIQLVPSGGYATEPKPSRPGHEFLGWYLSTDDADPYDFYTTAVTGDITLVARWEEIQTYIVVFDSDGGSDVPDQTVSAGGQVSVPDEPVKSGNQFVGWHLVTGDGMAAEAFDFSTSIRSDITLKAKWDPILYTVIFDSNGGSEVGPQVVPEGGKIVQPKVPVKSFYLFAGWHLVTEDGIVAEEFDFSNAVDSDITLKARWILIYTVTFDSDGGTAVKEQTIQYGKTAEKPDAPTKEGYIFAEWWREEQFFNFGTPITRSVALKAKWVDPAKVLTLPSGLASVKSGAFTG